MKTLLTLLTLLTLGTIAFAADPESPKAGAKAPSNPPPPVSVAPGSVPAGTEQTYVYEQKPVPGRPPLITPEQAQGIIDKFKPVYAKLGNPRLVVYVNRQLVDENSGLKLTARTEKIDTTRTKTKNGADTAKNSSATTEKASRENRYHLNTPSEPTLADRQTTRDVERLFGRPLRQAGASLADQRLATQLIGDKSPRSLSNPNDQAGKDREALSKIADVAIEVLISSKNVTVPGISSDNTYSVPDIQATAIQLKDAKILGQASSSDLLGREVRYDVREITEATALALMEDIVTGAQSAAANPKP